MDTGRPLVCERARSHVLGAVRTHALWLSASTPHSPLPFLLHLGSRAPYLAPLPPATFVQR